MTDTTPEEKKLLRAKRIAIYSRLGLAMAAIVIIFLSIRGCQNERAAVSAYRKAQDTIRALIADTSRIYAIARSYKAEGDDMKLRYAEVNAEKELFQVALISESNKSDRLLVAVEKAKADKDTVTLVKYIDTLSATNRLLSNRVQQLVSLQKKSDSIQNRRLQIADSLASHWELSYRGCIRAAEFVATELPKIKPSGKLYIDGAVKVGAIAGVGGGFSYIDAKGNKFSTNISFTNVGNVYEFGYGRLLSFNRKK
jgi:hypothetical protein